MGKFRAAIDDCELLEICLHNRKFTWSNERDNPTLVRLDRAFCNSEWEESFPNYGLNAMSTGVSDHCPIILNRIDKVPRKSSFKFENHWLHVQGFSQVVQQAWEKEQRGNALSVLQQKLFLTAKALRAWSKPLFSNIRLQLHIAKEVILRLDTAQENRQLSYNELLLRKELKLRALGLAAVERSRRRQASRITWLKSGDACTRFFHLKMSARRRRKYIYALKRQDGTLTWKHNEKEQIIHEHFSNLMGKKVPRSRAFNWDRLDLPRLQELPGLELDRPFNVSEIELAINSLLTGKAPGPDGFTSDFYKHCWPIIKPDIMSAFHSIHIQQFASLEQLNGAQVVLIPKVEVATETKDFRPISLIHSFAKLVTKVLATRLSSYIDKLIADSQSAFIKGRCIQDNFVYVRGLVRHYHRTRTPICLIKLDISKAFDTVSWEYLLQMLSHRGFSTRWTNWLTALLRFSSSRVMLNGSAGPKLMHARGLRQGDPLSPYLFILAMDVLSRIFDIATEEGHLTPLKGRQARLRLSLYADDVMIFTNPVKEDIACIMRTMKAFGEATGLNINMAKSSVATVRCADLDMDEILGDLVGNRVSFPIQYLGLPLTIGRTRMVHLQYIQDRAKSKLAGWQGKLVNVAGRRELVKSVLSSLPVYLLTVIKAPKQFLKEIDKMRRKFLWGELTGGKCKVAWATVCTPQPYGGLGIKDLDYFSQSLRLRWLWFSWDDRPRPWEGLQIPVTEEDKALFNAATVVELGNGKKASFWNSRWLNGEALASRFPLLHRHSKRKNRSVAQALTDNKWISDTDHNLSQPIIAEYLELWELLEDIVLDNSRQDTISWVLTSDGAYSAGSAYAAHFIARTKCEHATQLWKIKAPPKCKFFLWLLLQNRVWTAARLQARGWPNEYFCQLCLRNLETAHHLFCECPVTKEIWKQVGTWIQASSLLPENWTQTEHLQDWFVALIADAP